MDRETMKMTSFCFMGPENSGKSTLMGTLLQNLDQDYSSRLEILRVEKSREFIPSYYPYMHHGLNKVPKSIHVIPVENPDLNWVFIDTGRPQGDPILDDLKNIAMSDHVLFLIDASSDVDLFSRDLSKFATYLTSIIASARSNGEAMTRVLFVISKLDDETASRQSLAIQELYVSLCKAIKTHPTWLAFLKSEPETETKCHFIPVSAVDNQNIISKSDLYDWYTGPCLVEAMKTMKLEDSRQWPLRLTIVESTCDETDRVVLNAKLYSGTLREDDLLTIPGINHAITIKSLKIRDKKVQTCHSGDFVTFVTSIDAKEAQCIENGTFIGSLDDPLLDVESFVATVTSTPGISIKSSGYSLGYRGVLQCRTQMVKCVFQEFHSLTNKQSKQITQENPTKILVRRNEYGNVVFVPVTPMYVQSGREFSEFKRLMFVNYGYVVAIVKVTSVNYRSSHLGVKPNLLANQRLQTSLSDVSFRFA